MQNLVILPIFSKKGLQRLDLYDHASFKTTDLHFLKEQIFGYWLGSIKDLSIVLDIQGTPFQKKVWDEICKIPFGETITYKELAVRIGQSQSVRAVASACAQNKLGLIIPCHRVIASSGALSGYRWGLELKKQLLNFEKQFKSLQEGFF